MLNPDPGESNSSVHRAPNEPMHDVPRRFRMSKEMHWFPTSLDSLLIYITASSLVRSRNPLVQCHRTYASQLLAPRSLLS
ncbi:hypothetical protein BS17DRAFT_787169 [Gyrodon lividus]|nr:hypothetical protein BS17DRAFT_787169 [Gyrodon lividus]